MKFSFATALVAVALPLLQGAYPCLAAAILPRDSVSAYAYAEGDARYDHCPSAPTTTYTHTSTYHTTYTHTTYHTTYTPPAPTTHSTTHTTTTHTVPTFTPPPKPTTSATKTTTIVVTTTAPAASGGNQCSTGPVQCCNSVESSSSENSSKTLGLLGIVLQGLDIPVGLNCSPISVLGLGSAGSCAAQTVCCDNNNFNGLINLGCSPINLNL